MSKFRYTNLNNFPVWLPGERGEQVMFRPGEATTKNWFSRFIGNKQLTRVPNVAAPNSNRVPVLQPSLTQPAIVNSRPKPPSFANKETAEYSVRDGLYKCKLCGTFMTGSSESMQAHIKSFHAKPIVVEKPAAVDPDEKVVVTSKQSASVLAKTDTDEVTSSTAIEPSGADPDATPVPPEPDLEYTCDHPGCGKAFTSNRGLQMHITRVHGRDKG